MKTLKWNTKSGNAVELRASCTVTLEIETANMDGDIFEIGSKPYSNANLELWIDGQMIDSCWDTSFWKVIDSHQEGIKIVHGLRTIGMTPEQGAIVQDFLNAVMENGKSEEVREYEAAAAAKEMKQEIENAEDIVEKAQKQEKLMTEAEAKDWAEKYNNLYNEGGEGYIPTMITKELYEAALETLKRHS